MTTDAVPSAQRIWEHCETLARCSEQADGLTRVFLSEEQRAASALVLGWMREAGMSAAVDAIGNVIGRFEGATPRLPALVLGSHLDTVRDAGKYDGMLGVVAAIECVRTLYRLGKRLPFAIEVAGFADEEGVRFGATLLGSRALAGTFDPALLDRSDREGMTMREALTRFGLDPAMITCAARRRDDILAYAELHIEQGPVLEAEGLPVGVVTAINGANRFRIEVGGMAGHAGTVPMNLRQDALAAAAECVLAIERRCGAVPELVGTVGSIEVVPGATNVIPGRAVFTIDIRSPRDADRLDAVADVGAAIRTICDRRKVSVTLTQTHEGRTAAGADWIREQIGKAIADDGVPVRALPSGAGHDGMAMIDIADIGMLFVRCKGGISHNPNEAIALEDVEIAARIFLRFIENFRPVRSAA
jgi:allantoate deiminase